MVESLLYALTVSPTLLLAIAAPTEMDAPRDPPIAMLEPAVWALIWAVSVAVSDTSPLVWVVTEPPLER